MPASMDVGGVVAAIDFADDWHNTVAHATVLARARGGVPHLVHVVPPPNWLLGKVLTAEEMGAERAALEQAARARLEPVANASEVPSTVTVRTGRPAVEIVDGIRAGGASLLVLGLAEPTGTAMTVGPLADRLFRVSPIPTWVTGPKAPGPLRSIVVATALGQGGTAALEAALALVEPGGTVHALYTCALPSTLRSYGGDLMSLRERLAEQAATELRAHLAELTVPPGVRLEPVLRTNLETVPADLTIVKEARERSADLLCFALGGRELPAGMLIGRVSEKVVRALPCPLLALPDAWTRASG